MSLSPENLTFDDPRRKPIPIGAGIGAIAIDLEVPQDSELTRFRQSGVELTYALNHLHHGRRRLTPDSLKRLGHDMFTSYEAVNHWLMRRNSAFEDDVAGDTGETSVADQVEKKRFSLAVAVSFAEGHERM